ncbi:MAG: DEAD/DEAH box helicase [Desulfurococcales archaeon]|nr:DEAD/DEAH box helicase [Desulfurococcales archaeon]
MPRIEYKIRRWLSEDEFKSLLEFSDYLGYYDGYKHFVVNPEKMRNAGYKYKDVIAKLSEVDAEFTTTSRRVLEKLASSEDLAIVEYDRFENTFILSSDILLKPYLKQFLNKIKYSRVRRGYLVPPYLIWDVVNILRSYGLSIEDRSNILQVKKLPREITFLGKLRDYQEKALEAWRKNKKRGIIALPTGAGKTIVAIKAMAEANARTLIVVFTKDQLHQWIDKIKEFTDAGDLVGAYYSDEKDLAPITVTTYQTAFKKIQLFGPRFYMLIIDEAHHLPADKFRVIATGSIAPYRMGLSATVARDDGKHVEIFPLMGGVVYAKRASELVAQGYLAPYVIRRVYVDLEPEERKKYDQLRKRYHALAMGRKFNELLELAQRGDPKAIEAVRVNAQMRKIIAESEAKIKKIKQLIENELKKGSKILVFTQYKSQAEMIAKETGALLLHGGIDSKTRKRVLEKFRRMKSGALVVTTLGDEGLDLPDVNVGILASGTGSQRQYIQRLGRLVRPRDNKTAILYEVILRKTSEELQARKRRRWV